MCYLSFSKSICPNYFYSEGGNNDFVSAGITCWSRDRCKQEITNVGRPASSTC